MPPVWPASLPQDARPDGYREAFEDRRVVSATDTGPGKVRPISLRPFRRFALPFDLTPAQITTLKDFWRLDTRAGELRYDFPHPRTGVVMPFRFTRSPRTQPWTGVDWNTLVQTDLLLTPYPGLVGGVWTFQGNLRDRRRLTFTLNGGGTETYAAATDGLGIILSGSQYLSVALAQQGWNNPLLHTEGVIVVDFKPVFAGGDSVNHILVDTTGPNSRLQVHKDQFNSLVFRIVNSGGTNKQIATAVTWAANARIRIVASWDTTGTLKAWYADGSGAFVELTTASGAGSGIMAVLPTTLYIGGDNAGANLALGTHDTVAILKRAFTNPHLLLGSYAPHANGPLFWPPDLPLAPLIDGYDESFGELTLVSDVAGGEPEYRRRTVAAAQPITCQFLLTAAQMDTFEQFYEGDTVGGCLPFTWPHPRDGQVRAAFAGGPELSALGGDLYEVATSVEVLPT